MTPLVAPATMLEAPMSLTPGSREMDPPVGGLRPAVGRERGIAVGLVIVACVSPQLGAAFAVTLFDELGPAGAAFLRLAFAAIVLWVIWRPTLTSDLRLPIAF